MTRRMSPAGPLFKASAAQAAAAWRSPEARRATAGGRMVGAAAPELPPLPPPSAAKGEWYTSADGSLVTASANRGRRGTIQRRGSGNFEMSKAATAKMAIADAISATAKTKIGADRWQGRRASRRRSYR